MRGLSLVAASRGHSLSRCTGLSLSRPLLLRGTGSRRAGSVVVAHGPSCSAACGIFPDQGSNLCPLHWQADSQPRRHQGSPPNSFILAPRGHPPTDVTLRLHINTGETRSISVCILCMWWAVCFGHQAISCLYLTPKFNEIPKSPNLHFTQSFSHYSLAERETFSWHSLVQGPWLNSALYFTHCKS